jgi:hypothetical protein
MKILSFDIGIVNMAYCLMETDENKRVRILDWQVMNIAGIPDCSMCKKRAKSYVLLGNHKDPSAVSYYCSAHTKSYVEKHFQKKDIVAIKDTKDMDLDYLGANLYKQLEQRVQLFDNLDAVLFENQPVLKNPKMKSIQMILYSYFLHKKTLCSSSIGILKFYTAKKKLEIKGVNLDVSAFDKKEYKDRKTLGKLICKEILKRMADYENIHKLEDKTKQDDLCDCFVQGIEYLQTLAAFILDSN